MGSLEKSIGTFVDQMHRKFDQTNTLISDMESMMQKMKNEKEEKDKKDQKDKKQYSRQTVEPMTRLRETEEDVAKAKENPEMQFVVDRINDIFGT